MKSPEDPGKKSFNIGMIIIALLGMVYIIAMIIVSRPKPTHNVTDKNRVDTVERSRAELDKTGKYPGVHYIYPIQTRTYTTYK